MRDLVQPLARDRASARYVVEERPDLGGRRWTAERDQQHRIDASGLAGRGRHRVEMSWTMSTRAFTCSTGVDSRTPWPRLKMWPGRPAARCRIARTDGSNVFGGDSSATGSRLPCTPT